MTNDPRLERYLTALESALRPFPVSDRAEIITEIKSHVLDALDRESSAPLDQILAALGEPEMVANRYLIERGMKPTKPPISPIIKWLVIGFMGTVAMILLFTAFVFSRFTPILHVDDQNDRVTLLGGLLEVDGKNEQVYLRGFGGVKGSHAPFSGTVTVGGKDSVALSFSAGKVVVLTGEKSEFAWDCHGGNAQDVKPATNAHGADHEIALDLTKVSNLNCEIKVPRETHLSINGDAGKIALEKPVYDANVQLAVGKVSIEPSEGEKYHYDLKVSTGKIAAFDSSADPTARKISVQVTTGKIDQEN